VTFEFARGPDDTLLIFSLNAKIFCSPEYTWFNAWGATQQSHPHLYQNPFLFREIAATPKAATE
jgi:hypothetical protein